MAKTMFDSKLVFNKNMTEGIKRAVRERLQIFLDEKEKSFSSWNDNSRHRLNKTRQETVERRFHKEIQALKIVIHMLTAFSDRIEDEPSIFVKKPKAPKQIKGYLPASSTVVNDLTGPKMPTLSQDQISLLANLADLLKVKS